MDRVDNDRRWLRRCHGVAFFHFSARAIYLDAIKQQQETIEVLKQDLQHWESYAEKSRGISI